MITITCIKTKLLENKWINYFVCIAWSKQNTKPPKCAMWKKYDIKVMNSIIEVAILNAKFKE